MLNQKFRQPAFQRIRAENVWKKTTRRKWPRCASAIHINNRDRVKDRYYSSSTHVRVLTLDTRPLCLVQSIAEIADGDNNGHIAIWQPGPDFDTVGDDTGRLLPESVSEPYTDYQTLTTFKTNKRDSVNQWGYNVTQQPLGEAAWT